MISSRIFAAFLPIFIIAVSKEYRKMTCLSMESILQRWGRREDQNAIPAESSYNPKEMDISMNKKLIPTKQQLDFMDWEFGAFFHFGIRSFFPGYRDWDERKMPLQAFCPDQLDCRQWIQTVKDAGAQYAILVCKHHDGFANWPSAYTPYSVAKTPWKDGKGDVVQEFVDACREFDIKIGLYYSPAQQEGAVPFKDGREYDDYFIHQIGELLTNYGKIDYLWFDGCGSEHHAYDQERIIHAIRSMQPEILIFNLWDPDTRWIGNEYGYAPMLNCNIIQGVDFSVNTTEKETLEQKRFLPAECDFRMRSTWFDCEDNEETIKDVDELMGIYEMSVGRGANFLINIGPDRHGLLPKKDVERLREFGDRLRQRYGNPLVAFGLMQHEEDDCWSIAVPGFYSDDSPSPPVLVNRVILMEDLSCGEAIREFTLYAHLSDSTRQKICLYRGQTIGHKCICIFPTIRTGRIYVKINEKTGTVKLRSMQAYYEE